jgi:micrococcal nuclease
MDETGRPVHPSLRRRRLLRRGSLVAILLLALSAILDRAGAFGFKGDDWKHIDRKDFVVTSVVDGDTVHARGPDGNDIKVRLLGIDAPELNPDTPAPPDYWAERSKEYLVARVQGKAVTIKLEQTQTRDRFGRVLAYLYLSDNDNLNLDLVRDGQAYADRRFKHSLRPQFELTEGEARKKGTGLWKKVAENQMPEWRQRWLAEQRAR